MAKDKVLKLEHKPMHCPVCGARFMNIYGKPLPNHAQVRVTTTDGNEMDLGICEECSASITMETCKAVLEGIKDYWMFEIDDDKSLKAKDKKRRKDFHQSHKIDGIKQFKNTGRHAEQDARKRGKLE
jgi:hypothetical protein